jgi:hypothetical protein
MVMLTKLRNPWQHRYILLLIFIPEPRLYYARPSLLLLVSLPSYWASQPLSSPLLSSGVTGVETGEGFGLDLVQWCRLGLSQKTL